MCTHRYLVSYTLSSEKIESFIVQTVDIARRIAIVGQIIKVILLGTGRYPSKIPKRKQWKSYILLIEMNYIGNFKLTLHFIRI